MFCRHCKMFQYIIESDTVLTGQVQKSMITTMIQMNVRLPLNVLVKICHPELDVEGTFPVANNQNLVLVLASPTARTPVVAKINRTPNLTVLGLEPSPFVRSGSIKSPHVFSCGSSRSPDCVERSLRISSPIFVSKLLLWVHCKKPLRTILSVCSRTVTCSLFIVSASRLSPKISN